MKLCTAWVEGDNVSSISLELHTSNTLKQINEIHTNVAVPLNAIKKQKYNLMLILLVY